VTALAEDVVITEPGIYDGLPEDIYHRDPVPAGSLSFSGAKKLLPPSTPARFKYDRDNPPAPSQAMELGTAAHKLILGTGPDLVVVDAKDWRTNAAKEAAAEIRAAGCVPLLPPEMAQVKAMAAAIRAHPVASALFDPERGGHAEQSLFWPDETFGIWRRCRMDWMPDLDGPRPILGDYKTTGKTADHRAIARAMTDYRYFMQHPWYADGVKAITGLDLPFVFCFQETAPPYLISVAQLSGEDVRSGRAWNTAACERYRDCTESGVWPGYSNEVQRIVLPAWVARGDFE
jgi:PDDEXK-like domain of unknown function (DUF3799)